MAFAILSGRAPAIQTREADTLEDAAWEARQCASRGQPAAVVIRHADGREPKPVFAIWADGRDYRESKTPRVGAQVLGYIRGRGGLPT
jgi:hypothetical protein